MAIKVQCSSCNSWFKAPDNAGGKRVKCPKCSKPIEIPVVVAPSLATKEKIASMGPITDQKTPNDTEQLFGILNVGEGSIILHYSLFFFKSGMVTLKPHKRRLGWWFLLIPGLVAFLVDRRSKERDRLSTLSKEELLSLPDSSFTPYEDIVSITIKKKLGEKRLELVTKSNQTLYRLMGKNYKSIFGNEDIADYYRVLTSALAEKAVNELS